jgi:xanthine dehydrogenase accessory factor
VTTLCPDASPYRVLRALHDWQARREAAALVIITAIEGRTPRAVGGLMAVRATGESVGSISGGCFDAAVVAEAQKAINAGHAQMLRLGAGSPWIDIKLPCGGAIELLIVANPDSRAITHAIQSLSARNQSSLCFVRPDGERVEISLSPPLHLVVAGNGGELAALARLALTIEAEVTALSSEAALLASLDGDIRCVHLKTADALGDLSFDRWTAVAVCFHDHDWEPPLLARALASDAYFVGAMGSLATHETRRAALLARGMDQTAISRIVSPLGLFGPTRDPQALAVSALAQIVAQRP